MKREQHKILLINPPWYRLFKNTYSHDRYPLGLGYLAGTTLKETNWSVMVYNADFYPRKETRKGSYLTGTGFDNYLDNLNDLSKPVWEEIKSTILEYKPTVVGISAVAPNFASVCIVAKLAKIVNDQIIVIVGGPHPTTVGADVLNCPDIDVAVKGEGENTIVELLNTIEVRKQFDSIQGIIYRKEGQIVENAQRGFIKNLDSLCFPHESAAEVLKDYDQYPLTAFGFVFAIRGCPYNCFFCASRYIWSRKVRFRSPEHVIGEIKGLQKMGLRLIHFDDDTFGISKKYINDLCSAIIAHCRGLKWSCEIHANLVDEQNISIMKAAGCYLIQVGIESGNNEILKKLRKHTTIEEVLSSCEIIKKHGITVQGFFIPGLPWETEDTLRDTVTALKKTKGAPILGRFTPYQGTEAFEFCKEKGLISDDYDIRLNNRWSSANCFTMNITPERFRILVSKMETTADRKKSLYRIKQVFSLITFRRIQELGIRKSFQEGKRVFIGKQ